MNLLTLISSILLVHLNIQITLGSDEISDNEEAEANQNLGVQNRTVTTSGPAVTFCCPDHHYFNASSHACIDSGLILDPTFYTMAEEIIENEDIKFTRFNKFHQCDFYFLPENQFKIRPNGMLHILDSSGKYGMDKGSFIPSDRYCLLWIPSERGLDMSSLVCFEDEDPTVSRYNTVVNEYMIPICMGISSIFLAATFTVYCLVQELRDLLGKSFMCALASMCLSKAFGAVLKAFTPSLSVTACVTIAMLMHLGFLYSFFWLNVLSFLLFFSIYLQGRLGDRSKIKWFGVSCLYAFGVPLVIMGLVLIHDLTSHLDNKTVPKPGFGIGSCGFTNRDAHIIYFYAPIAFLLSANLILFGLSAHRIYILAKRTITSSFQFKHYLKLLLMMGIPWIFEVLSFFLDDDEKVNVVTFIWLLFDLINALQGVIIFFVFVCRRTVLSRTAEVLCGIDYASKKFPDVFLIQANDEVGEEGFTQERMLVDFESPSLTKTDEMS